jgi:hypothetical protein
LHVPANRVRPRSARLPSTLTTGASDISTTLVAVERHLRLASSMIAFDAIHEGARFSSVSRDASNTP